MLLKQAVDEFKKIYKDEFGKELTDIQATEKAQRLFDLFKVVLRKQNEKKLEKRLGRSIVSKENYLSKKRKTKQLLTRDNKL